MVENITAVIPIPPGLDRWVLSVIERGPDTLSRVMATTYRQTV
jgi:hypothetical protein